MQTYFYKCEKDEKFEVTKFNKLSNDTNSKPASFYDNLCLVNFDFLQASFLFKIFFII